MVTIMDMNTGKIIGEPPTYDDEVLNANWMPPRLEPTPQLQPVEHVHPAPLPPPTMDVEHFLEAVYRYQE